jgi:archaellum biogenesis protein FlaJ (TadC family)
MTGLILKITVIILQLLYILYGHAIINFMDKSPRSYRYNWSTEQRNFFTNSTRIIIAIGVVVEIYLFFLKDLFKISFK